MVWAAGNPIREVLLRSPVNLAREMDLIVLRLLFRPGYLRTHSAVSVDVCMRFPFRDLAGTCRDR